MFKHITILAALLAMLLAGCTGIPFGSGIIGSGRPVTQEYDLAGFDAVDASNGFQVTLAPGDGFSVKVTVDDNVTDYLVVEKHGDTLHIGLDNRGGWFSTRNLRAEVTLPELRQVGLSGGSSATMAGFPAVGSFTAELSGGSRLQGDVAAEDVSLTGSGGSRFVLAGSAQNLSVSGSGGSRAELAELVAQQANMDLSGGSQASIQVVGELNYNISGGSRLTYGGDPAIGRSDASGGSEAVRGD
jgi:hypothetical protein